MLHSVPTARKWDTTLKIAGVNTQARDHQKTESVISVEKQAISEGIAKVGILKKI